MKKHKNKLITAIIIVILLTAAFFHGQAPKQDITSKPSATNTAKDNNFSVITEKATQNETAKPVSEGNKVISQKMVNSENTPSGWDTTNEKAAAKTKKSEEKEESKTDFTSIRQMYDNVNPENTEDIPITDKEHTCTLSVRCDTILSNMEDYGEKRLKTVPPDGIIYPEKQVVFYEGESVFNLLLREMKINGIHFEFVNTPLYKTAYIEGINNIYEFDFGELSGWMYKVNGVFLRYGCSSYILKEGDRVEWVYTCNLGKDVGDFNFEGI